MTLNATAIVCTAALLGLVGATPLLEAAQARPRAGGGVGGPASGAGVRPGAGWGAPGAGMTRGGAGVRPGVGWGAPGAGLTRAPGVSAWNPGWARRGYWPSRTWATGWFRPYPAAWPWWRTSSVAWGVTGLATAAAADQPSTVIVVPQTSVQLDYGFL